MVKSVIDIDVNDDKFKAFMEVFKKYQETLKANPRLWKKSSDQVDTMVSGFQNMTAALMAQRTIERQIDAERAKERKKTGDALKAQATAEKQRLADQKKALAVTQKIAGEIGKTTVNLLKWASIGTLAEIGTDLLGFWGLKEFAGGIGAARKSAGGLNVSVGEQRAMQIDFGRYINTDAALEKTANAVQDPSQWWAFSQLGVNTKGKDTAEVLLEVQRKIMQQSQKVPTQLLGMMSQAYGWNTFFDDDEIRQLKKQGSTKAGWEEYNTQVKNYGADKVSADVMDSAGRKWQDFVAALDRGTAKFRALFIDKLTAMEPQLEHFAAKLIELGTSLLDRVDFAKLDPLLDKFNHWLNEFADYLGSPKFDQDVKLFTATMNNLITWASNVLAKLGFGYASDAAPGSPTAIGGKELPTSKLSSKQLGKVETDFYKFFKLAGMNDRSAAAFAVNLGDEGGGNPFAQGDYVKGKGYTAYGLGQWHADRQQEYINEWGHSMQSVKDPKQAMYEQLKFVLYELAHKEQRAAHNIDALGFTPERAGNAVSRYYERPGKTRAEQEAEASRRGSQTKYFSEVVIRDNRTDVGVSANAASK